MRARLERVAESAIQQSLADGWGLELDALSYFPEGGGAYHWIADAVDGRRWLVTVDDLAIKPWLGTDPDVAFRGLMSAYEVAAGLHASGLAFVVAPVPSRSGAPVERLDARHTVALFEHIDGEPQTWGRRLPPGVTDEVVRMLAALHQSTAVVRSVARRGIDVAGRDGLEAALSDLDGSWEGGPLSEPARRELAEHADLVARWLTQIDAAAADLAGSDAGAVVTHGEPHPGNLIRTNGGLALVDWDTVALARPERDLWMLVDGADDVPATYKQLTGVTLDRDALSAYRLVWAVTDVAAFTLQLRGEHARDADANRALGALRSIFEGLEPAPYGRPR